MTQQELPFDGIKYKYVLPYSDGLDSFAQKRLLEKDVGPKGVLKLRSARIGQDSPDLQHPVLRVPRHLGSMHKPEKTYRSRPFVFFSFAAIGAFVAEAESVVVGGSGKERSDQQSSVMLMNGHFEALTPDFCHASFAICRPCLEKKCIFNCRSFGELKGKCCKG